MIRNLFPNYNGIKIGNIKILSPNSASNRNIGGTIIKFGKYLRIDVEAYQLLHLHSSILGKLHLQLGTYLAGIIGGLYEK